ncbi:MULTISPECIES: hypothetical protein [Stenotrophomonas]|uniref:hypothetical protein n=1 Tax=Stenotrophomonas TaxID=40323 RepID=UPI000A973F86|nr:MULTISPECIES: hypothetical protein [Stenotrophomonas]MBH1409487.1 hypothetical protein [Stenotrophomonas maltophilia]MBH1746051.1 hypothetical protein [Stenotrophomonas maltophilia]MBH1865791.1 hypothetical protein [Stenotrophomonas maltophilia]MDH1387918.1 hypothetical protein [Stenotrophomonas sp. GD03701]MDH1393915.1 hypothetical protein [Stenotrophomonas sp. GD03702]
MSISQPSARQLGAAAVSFALYLAVAWSADWFGMNGRGTEVLFLRLAGAGTASIALLLSFRLFLLADTASRLVFLAWAMWLGAALALVWPGILMSDTYSAYLYGLNFPIDSWLGFMTPVGYQFVLQVIPKYWAISLVQVLMAAMLLAYADWTVRRLGGGLIARIVLHLPLAASVAFVSTSLLLSRDVPFAMIQVALALVLLNYLLDRHWTSTRYIVALSLLSALGLVVRTDGLLPAFIAMAIVLIKVLHSPRSTALLFSAFAAPLLVCSLLLPSVLGEWQNRWGYQLTLALNPLGQLVQGPYYESTPGAARTAVDPIIPYDRVVERSIPQEIPLYWDQAMNPNATEEQKQGFLAAVTTLIVENPAKFVSAKLMTAGYASGLGPRTLTFVEGDIAGNWSTLNASNPYYSDGRPMSHVRSLFGTLGPSRESVMAALSSTTQYQGMHLKGSFLWWNFIPELVLLLLVVLAYRWAPASSLAAVLILSRIPAMVLFAPGSHFKYYFTVEIAGSVLLITAFLEARLHLQGTSWSTRLLTGAQRVRSNWSAGTARNT